MSENSFDPQHARIGIIGLGYVGLPLATIFAEAGYRVLGFDVSRAVCDGINAGLSHIKDIPTPRLAPLVQQGLVEATTDFERLAECTAISICVPTPLNKIKDPDLSSVSQNRGICGHGCGGGCLHTRAVTGRTRPSDDGEFP